MWHEADAAVGPGPALMTGRHGHRSHEAPQTGDGTSVTDRPVRDAHLSEHVRDNASGGWRRERQPGFVFKCILRTGGTCINGGTACDYVTIKQHEVRMRRGEV